MNRASSIACALGLAVGCLAAAACSGDPTESPGGKGGGGAAAGGGGGGTQSVSSSNSSGGAGGGTSMGGSGGTGGAVMGPRLVIPAVIDLPFTIAGQGGSQAKITVGNDGDAPLPSLLWVMSGDPSITLASAPASLAAGESQQITLSYAGSTKEAISTAQLSVMSPQGTTSIPVFAVSGDPGVGEAAWEDVIGAGGTVMGAGATIDLPMAPYPDAPSAFTDASVRVFLPEGYRDRGAHDVVLHFHGWNATLTGTLEAHLYQEQLWASGANAVLVVPQGPVSAPSGDFGKLMKPGGLGRLLDEVLVTLYREGKITHPALGRLVLTSHSGGYRAVATNLDPASLAPAPVQVNLFDSLYGYESTFEAFALGGGLLRSNYTSGGGTVSSNQEVATYLEQHGLSVADEPTQRSLKDAPAVIDFTPASHDGSTHVEGAFGERLRWTLGHSRRGPRIELRQAIVEGGLAKVTWLAPPDEDVSGYVVERSSDGQTWTTAATTSANATSASFALSGGARVRVRAEVPLLPANEVLASDTYRLDAAPTVLVVDGFDRVLDGSFGGLRHDFAALVGEAAGAVGTVSHRAITEDGFDISSWPTVLWLLGDESTLDRSLSAEEQQILRAFLDAGGRLIVSGSELAWELAQTTAGASFLDHAFGAKYQADNAGSHSVQGVGPLAALGASPFAGVGAPYACPYPDALSAAASGEVLLVYSNGKAAAVGVEGRAALVGFPLELIDSAADRAAIVEALLAYVGG